MREIKPNDIVPFVNRDAACYLISEDCKSLWSKRGRCIMLSTPGKGFYISSATGRRRYWIEINKHNSNSSNNNGGGGLVLMWLLYLFLLLLFLFLSLLLVTAFHWCSGKNESYKDYVQLYYKDGILQRMSESLVHFRDWRQSFAQVPQL